MSSGARWTNRILIVGFGLLLGFVFAAGALDSAAELGATTEAAARRTLQLSVAGQLLTAVGFVGLYTCLAIRFRDWASVFHPFTHLSRVPDDFRGIRRANRQIDGAVSYHEHEVAHLRRVAERRVATRRLTPLGWIECVVMILLFGGFIMAPPDYDSALATQGFRLLCGVNVLVYTAAVLKQSLKPTDAKAAAFLERTQPIPRPVDDSP